MSNASTPARSACATRALARAAGAVAAAVLSTVLTSPKAYGQRVFGLDTSSAANTNSPSQTAWNNAFNDADGNGVAYKFAIVRSSRGGTVDSTRLDDAHFYDNISRATTAGMLAGSYHYSRPDVDTHTAVDDANHYLERAGMYMKPGYMLPVFDLEAGNTFHTTASLTAWGLDFISTINAATGVNPIVYTSSSYNNDEVNANLAWLNVDGSTSTPHTGPRTYQWLARPSGSLTTGQPGAAANYPNPYGVWDANFNSRTNSRDPAVNPWVFWQNGAGSPNGFLIDYNAANGNIEFVKDFLVPALWTNAGSGDWGTIANWNSDNPGHIAGNTATGPAPRLPNNSSLDWVKLQNPGGGTVTISSGARSVRKFYTQQPLNITGGSLTVSYVPGSGGKWDLPSEFAAPVTLGSSTAYTAHTTQVNGGGGVFNLNAGTVTARAIDLASHATTPGKLVMGASTVTFNAYGGTGTTVIRATGSLAQPGVIEIANPIVSGPTFSVGNGSAGVDLDIRAGVTGPGVLRKAGAGTMQLSSANTHTGGTSVSGGVLQITADNRLGAVPGSAHANNIVLSGGTLRTGTQVNAVSLTNAGSGYTSFPTLTIGGAGADVHAASANVLAGITSIAVTNGGGGYVNQVNAPPTNTSPGTFVDIVGGGGTGATARAVVSGGVVTSIVITNAGTGYTSMPTIHISSTGLDTNPDPGVTELFGGSGAVASVNGIALQSIALNDGGFDYANPTITLTGGGGSGATASATSTPNWTLNANRGIQIGFGGGTLYQTAGSTLNVGGIISSQVGAPAGSFTKSGPGTLALSGANTYSGGTIVNGGTLNVSGASGLGSTNGSLTVNNPNTLAGTAVAVNLSNTAPTTVASLSGTISNPSSGTNTVTINNGGQAFTVNQTATGTFAGVIAGAGSFTKGGTAALTLSGANTYGGGTTVNAGTLNVSGPSGLGASSGPLAVNNPNTGPGTAVVLNLSTTSPTTTGSLSGAIATPSSGANTATINNGGQLLTVNQTTPGTYQGAIAGAGGLTKTGPGTLALTAANNYTGGTTVSAGNLVAGHADAFGTNRPLTVNTGATAATSAGLTKAMDLSTVTFNGTGTLDLNDNALVIRNGSLPAVYALVKSGFENGGIFDWNGTGIRSTAAAAQAQIDGSTGIGVTSNDNLGYTDFQGVTGLTGTSSEILMTYTFLGDSDLDLDVDGNDFLAFLTGISSVTGGWEVGDSDYDGDVDSSDFLGFLTGLSAYENSQMSLTGGQVAALYAQAEAGTLTFDTVASVVPEPATAGVLAMGAAGLLARRGRRATAGRRCSI